MDSVYLFLILLNFSAILISARGGGSLFMGDDKIKRTRVKIRHKVGVGGGVSLPDGYLT